MHYWRLQERQRFHDGALVAELLVAVRQSLDGHRRWVVSIRKSGDGVSRLDGRV
jgi:hypothetical protein